jgi:hypothetical protein
VRVSICRRGFLGMLGLLRGGEKNFRSVYARSRKTSIPRSIVSSSAA